MVSTGKKFSADSSVGKKQWLRTGPSGVGCQVCDAVAMVHMLRSLYPGFKASPQKWLFMANFASVTWCLGHRRSPTLRSIFPRYWKIVGLALFCLMEKEVNVPLGEPELTNLPDSGGVSLHPPFLLGTGLSLASKPPKQGAEDAVWQPKIFPGGSVLEDSRRGKKAPK